VTLKLLGREAPRRTLPGLSRAELAALPAGLEAVNAVREWLATLPAPTDAPPAELPRRLREALPTIGLPTLRLVDRAAAEDGTCKLLLELSDGARVEAVLIPANGRTTVCISTQVGCTRTCAFCATARLGFTRNLEAGELVGQVLLARREAAPGTPVRNVVFMGMGEPLDNLDEVLAATRVLQEPPLLELRASRITVSSSGVLPGMERFLAESPCAFALSLNGTTDEQRAAIMPQTRRWPIAALLDCLRAAAARDPRRRFFIEYVLLAGHDDSPEDADRLAALLHGLPCTVNLIPHNPFPGSPFLAPSREVLFAFHARVRGHGLHAFTRWPRGADVAAACGLLARRQSAT